MENSVNFLIEMRDQQKREQIERKKSVRKHNLKAFNEENVIKVLIAFAVNSYLKGSFKRKLGDFSQYANSQMVVAAEVYDY